MRRFLILLPLLALAAAIALIFPPFSLAQAGDAIPDAENLAAWATITGLALPWLIAFLVQSGWSKSAKVAVSVAVCVADAVVVTGFTHGWHFDSHLLATFGAVLVLAQTTYRSIWSQIGAAPGAEPIVKRFEKATSAGQ